MESPRDDEGWEVVVPEVPAADAEQKKLKKQREAQEGGEVAAVAAAAPAAEGGKISLEDMLDQHPRSIPFQVQGVSYALLVSYPGIEADLAEARSIARTECPGRANLGCRACIERTKYIRYLGRDGPLFLQAVDSSSPQVSGVQRLAHKACGPCRGGTSYEFVLVEEDTFEPVEKGREEGTGKVFKHWTVIAEPATSPSVATRIKGLRALWLAMDTRLGKLLGSEAARQSVAIMEQERQKLARPAHWGRVLRWVTDLQKQYPKDWTQMSEVERWQVRVFALASGAAEGAAHQDFFQSSNIVDFLEMPSRDALRREMDQRSDPAFYQVSQLNRRLVAQGITSERTIGLTWDGKFKDDLDIHVVGPSGQEISFSKKQTQDGKLDFDANVTKGEAEPCENVSCTNLGPYRVYVNNYTRRTANEPVPFDVVVREKGCPDKVFSSVWTVDRQKGNKIHVCTHTFGQEAHTAGEAEMTAKGARRIQANDAHWQEHVGDPVAFIATLEDLGKSGCPVTFCRTGKPASETRRDHAAASSAVAASVVAGSGLMAMVSSARTGEKKKKMLLSEHCAARPTTVAELVALLDKDAAKGISHDLAVMHRDHAPGYLVDIKAKTDTVRKLSSPAVCHFQNKFQLPVKPDSVGTARMDSSWGRVRQDGKVSVVCITKVEGKHFLVLEGAKLPRNSDFPLAGGFYPTDLSSDCHVHRERWAYYHSQLEPVVKEKGVPTIGTFLTTEKAVVYLDGVQETLAA